jgi:Kef-type K+ transport system membrane component KefB
LARYTPIDAAMLGAGMISRGEVGLIIASVGITEGLMGEDGFSMIVLMVVVTTILTPPLLRYIHHLKKNEDERKQDSLGEASNR